MFANYHVLSGPATPKRTGGTQLWIAKEVFGLSIDKTHLRTLVAQDRILVAALRHPQLHIGVVVLHAPSSDQEEVLEQWWQEVDQHIQALQSIPFFVLMDANNRVGSITSQCIGDHQPSSENQGGIALHHWLRKHDLYGCPLHSPIAIMALRTLGNMPRDLEAELTLLRLHSSSGTMELQRGLLMT